MQGGAGGVQCGNNTPMKVGKGQASKLVHGAKGSRAKPLSQCMEQRGQGPSLSASAWSKGVKGQASKLVHGAKRVKGQASKPVHGAKGSRAKPLSQCMEQRSCECSLRWHSAPP